ncbi:MAG: hypothetical protein ACYDHM_16870 [Acidiferrobacterales bacterium]
MLDESVGVDVLAVALAPGLPFVPLGEIDVPEVPELPEVPVTVTVLACTGEVPMAHNIGAKPRARRIDKRRKLDFLGIIMN